MKTFQMVLMMIFATLGLIGVATFALYKGKSNDPVAAIQNVVVWGTVEQSVVNTAWSGEDPYLAKAQYKEVSADNFITELQASLLNGGSPDLLIVDDSLLVQLEDNVTKIPYDSYSTKDFKGNYIQAAEALFTYGEDGGILGYPLTLDPLVLYWNREIFNQERLLYPPKTWDEVLEMEEKLTKEDLSTRDILRSTIGLGSFENITHAKDIMIALGLQLGIQLVNRTEVGYDFNDRAVLGDSGLDDVVRFYTEFSNIQMDNYTWNSALPESRDMFAAGDLAMYIGYASEYDRLAKDNPNLDFDMGPLPQLAEDSLDVTGGKLYSLLIFNQSGKQADAGRIAQVIAGADNATRLAAAQRTAPTYKVLLSQTPDDELFSLIFSEAPVVKLWHDPNPIASDSFFGSMLQSVVSGSKNISNAVDELMGQLRSAI